MLVFCVRQKIEFRAHFELCSGMHCPKVHSVGGPLDTREGRRQALHGPRVPALLSGSAGTASDRGLLSRLRRGRQTTLAPRGSAGGLQRQGLRDGLPAVPAL